MSIQYLKQLYANNAETVLSSTITSSATSIPLADGTAFPQPTSGQFFSLTIDDGTHVEIVYAYGRSGGTLLNCLRGREGTTARSYPTGTQVECRLTSGAIRNFARNVDVLAAATLLSDLAAPETLNNHSYVVAETDDSGTPIVAFASSGIWGLMNYPVVVLTQAVVIATTTSVQYSGPDVSALAQPKSLVIQFTSGAHRGKCRSVTSATSSSLSWGTALPTAPSVGDTYRVLQSYTAKFQSIIGVDSVTLPQMNAAIASGISGHVAQPNPHSQYQTASQVSSAVSSGIDTHVAAADPHTQYTKASEVDTIVDTAVTDALSTHVAQPNPHSQYQTASQVSSAVSSGIAAHVAAADPHTQYTKASEVDTAVSSGIATHVAAADPHTQYVREWVSGVAYSSGYVVISPMDYRAYYALHAFATGASTTDPSVDSGWALKFPSYSNVGAVKYWCRKTAPSGWLEGRGDHTIGGASSIATYKGDVYYDLYALLWSDFTDTSCPMTGPAGAVVLRGASVATDWAAGNRIALPELRASFLRGWDHGLEVDYSGGGAAPVIWREFGSLQQDANAYHTHTAITSPAGAAYGELTAEFNGWGGIFPNPTTSSGVLQVVSDTLLPNVPQFDSGGGGSYSTMSISLPSHEHTIAVTGAGDASEARPRNVALLACIGYL